MSNNRDFQRLVRHKNLDIFNDENSKKIKRSQGFWLDSHQIAKVGGKIIARFINHLSLIYRSFSTHSSIDTAQKHLQARNLQVFVSIRL